MTDNSIVKVYKKIDAKPGVMIAGWPGMGNVAIETVDYIRKKLGAEKIAEVRLDPMATLDSVVVEDGVASFPPFPHNTFYYIPDPNLVLFVGEAQLPGKMGIGLMHAVLEYAKRLGVKKVITGAAFPMPVSCKETPRVYAAATKKPLIDMMRRFGVRPMEDGHISGLNGLVLGFAREKSMDALCLLSTMPQYAIGLPNPKAVWAIIEVLRKALGFKIGFQELEDEIRDMEEKMVSVEEKIGPALTVELKDEGDSQTGEKKVPSYITQKIERLFKETESDKTKASILKKELDRWDLYKFYEDRFLDLFK